MLILDVILYSLIGGFLASYLLGGNRTNWLVDALCGFGGYILYLLLDKVLPVNGFFEVVALVTVLSALVQLVVNRVRK